jgi:hypothetical protein
MRAIWLVVVAACGSSPTPKTPTAPTTGSAAVAPTAASGGPHDSRLAIAQAAFAALSAGDVDKLLALSGAKAIYEDAMACESTEMETKAIEQRLRVEYRQPAQHAKGLTIEVIEVQELERDEVASVPKDKRVQGCTARVDVHVHEAKVKLKVSKDAEQGEPVVKLGVVEVEGKWYLRKVPARVGFGGPWKMVLAKLTDLTDKMCKCADATCAETVNSDYYTWIREISAELGEERPDDATMAKLTELSERFQRCYAKAAP